MAREMAARGDWVTPRLDALRYFERPPLQYWATAAAYQAFGESEWSARLWAALTGFLGLLLTGWIGSRLYGAAAGTLAALVQAGALLYLGLARILTLDMGLTATLELALCGLLLLVQPERKEADDRLGALLLALGVTLAFLAKGLVGILIPGAVALLYLLLRRAWGFVPPWRPLWFLLAPCPLSRPPRLARQRGKPALALLAGRSLAALGAPVVRRALLIGGAFWLLLGLSVLVLWREPGMAARLDIASGPAGPAIAGGFLLAALLTAVAAWLAPRRGVVASAATATLGSLALLTVLLPAAKQMPGQRGLEALIAAAAAQVQAGTTLYCVDDYEQSIPFYLKRPCTLVGYRGELDFGLRQEPERWIPDLGQFSLRWQCETQALGVIRAVSFPELRRMGLPMRVIYTAPSLVAVVRK